MPDIINGDLWNKKLQAGKTTDKVPIGQIQILKVLCGW